MFFSDFKDPESTNNISLHKGNHSNISLCFSFNSPTLSCGITEKYFACRHFVERFQISSTSTTGVPAANFVLSLVLNQRKKRTHNRYHNYNYYDLLILNWKTSNCLENIFVQSYYWLQFFCLLKYTLQQGHYCFFIFVYFSSSTSCNGKRHVPL